MLEMFLFLLAAAHDLYQIFAQLFTQNIVIQSRLVPVYPESTELDDVIRRTIDIP